MKPLRLYIENFACHDNSFIDFTLFNAALIVGKVENNDLFSNGVGKTTVFKAIEYALFNQSDSNLEKIIRDDANQCQVVLDFIIGENEYRIVRRRTKKSSDVSLFKRNSVKSNDNIYHIIKSDNRGNIYVPSTKENFWDDLSGRRASDTEKEIEKLIKINFKAFRNTIHFIQNDLMGMATATPENRKKILKEALYILVYSKLEKIAKDKSSSIIKNIEKNKTLIESLGDPNSFISSLNEDLVKTNELLECENNNLSSLKLEIESVNNEISNFSSKFLNIKNELSSLLDKEKFLKSEETKISDLILDYKNKKSSIVKLVKNIIEDVNNLKDRQAELMKIDLSEIESLNDKIIKNKEKITELNVFIQTNLSKYEDLKIPMPTGSLCKHCRQSLSEEHVKNCKVIVNKEMEECQNNISSSKNEISSLNKELLLLQKKLTNLISSKQEIESINSQIDIKNKEISSKKDMHDEYVNLINKYVCDLELTKKNIEEVKIKLENSSINELNLIKDQIDSKNNELSKLNDRLIILNKEIIHHNSARAIILNNIAQKEKDLNSLNSLKQSLSKLEEEYSIYPHIIQAFSSSGIPALIIQDVLDDFQLEANNLLSQLKPGLQLSFVIEKTVEKTGDQADTLDINYTINGKERYYEQLSGAQKLAVAFSLKLGLSFLLSKRLDVDMKLLLLDEIDQSLDKASVDAFADIVKFFQNDFTILVITHNDRLKDKFNHAILVEQDSNMISRACVVSNW